MDSIEKYWHRFLESIHLDPRTRYYEGFAFGSGEKMADDLLRLVLDGKKRATTSCVMAFENRPLPAVGDYSIVLDGKGSPRCVIQTVRTRRLRFSEMDFETCNKEGEDDSLDSWRRNHERFFSLEAKESGYEFSPDLPLLFEEFMVVFQ